MTVARDWLDDVMPRVAGASEELVLQEISSAMRELCEDGMAWPLEVRPLGSVADDPALDIGAALQALLGQPGVTPGNVMRLTFSPDSGYQRVLAAAAAEPLRLSETADDPAAYMMVAPSMAHLYPTPRKDHPGAYTATVTVVPTAPDVVFPEFFRSHYLDAVMQGVLARMLPMGSKPWTDKASAVSAARSSRNHIKRSRAATLGRFTAAQGWAFPFFAQGSGSGWGRI